MSRLCKPQCYLLYSLRFIRTSRSSLYSNLKENQSLSTKNTSSLEVVFPDWLVETEHSNELSFNILNDNSLYITKEESSKFIVPKPRSDNYFVVDWVYNNFVKSLKFQHVAITLNVLSLSQIQNQSLLDSLNIDNGFNMKLYFYIIHLWIIHRRLIKIRPYGQIIISELFTVCWDMITRWIMQKPGKHNIRKELENIKKIVQVFCMEMNVATQCKSLIPIRMAQILYKFMYIDADFTRDGLIRCVKYIMRQFLHIQNLDDDTIMDARFSWASYDGVYDAPKVFGLATPSLLKPELDSMRISK